MKPLISENGLRLSIIDTVKKLWFSLTFQVTTIMILVILLVSSITNFFIFSLSYKTFQRELQDKLSSVAANAALAIDVDKLKKIQSKEDAKNKIYLVLATTPLSDQANHSAVGDQFPTADFPAAMNGFKYPTADLEAFPDEEFNTISQSGYAPLKDAQGRVVGMLGIKMDVSPLKKEEDLKNIALNAFLLAAFLALVLGVIFSLYLTIPILTLKKNLAFKMEQKEKEYQDNINQIVEIIKADQELFEDFVTECKEQIQKVEPKLIVLKDKQAANSLEIIDDLFRTMHTIKGNAKMFNLERVAGQAHSIENIFAAIRKGEKALTSELLDNIFEKLDYFNTIFYEIIEIYQKIINGKNIDSGKTRTEKRLVEESAIIKVKVEKIQRLSELIKKVGNLVAEKPVEFDNINLTCDKKIEEIQILVKETEKQIVDLQKVSMNRLFTRFPRMVRDISREFGKKINFRAMGEEVVVDKSIFNRIADPLIHLLRNSLDHGIEKPEERVLLGKPAEGKIGLTVEATATELVITIEDDGRGLDANEIKKKAVAKGLISQDKAALLSEDEAINLIFRAGFSTSDQVNSISGRGVGMDVVQNYVEEKLRGKVKLYNRKNQGLKVVLLIPLMNS